jgi:hypothetical protein
MDWVIHLEDDGSLKASIDASTFFEENAKENFNYNLDNIDRDPLVQ